jgi:uracil-DNA glycosylase
VRHGGAPADIARLVGEVRACRLCEPHLALGARPVLQVHPDARILIAGQAPGSKVHRSGIPFDDASGERLRDWMGIDKATFYDATRVAILPMGFCYPGAGASGDLPPRPECAPAWRARLLARMPRIELTLVIGRYAQAWHLKGAGKADLTQTVMAWRNHWPALLALPHPSPRNNIWLKRNGWFESEVIPVLRGRVQQVLVSHRQCLAPGAGPADRARTPL